MGIMKNNMSRNVRKLIIRYSPLLLLAVMLSFILSKLIVIGSEIISNSINVMISGEQIYMKELFLKMGIIIIISMIISFLQSFFSGIFGVRVQKECKNQIIEAVEKADCLLLNHTGSVLNKLTSDITDMGKLLSELLPEIIQYGVTIIVIGIAILKMNWIIFAGVIVILPISLFISNRIAVRLGVLAKKRRGKYDELSNIALDSIGGIEIAKSYCIEKLLGKRVHEKAEEILKNEYARNRYQALANGLIMLIKWVPTIICSLIALAMVLNRTISIGELMAFIVLFNLGNINLTERVREIATIEVLGFYPREMGSYVFRENFILVLIGIVAGLPTGYVLHKFIMSRIVVDAVSFNEIIEPASYVFTVLTVIGFSVIVDLILRRKMRRINMAEALKSIE